MKFKKIKLALSLILSSAAITIPCSTIFAHNQTINKPLSNSTELKSETIQPHAVLNTTMKPEVENFGLNADGALADVYLDDIANHEVEVKDFIERNVENIFNDPPPKPYNIKIINLYKSPVYDSVTGLTVIGACDFEILAYQNNELTELTFRLFINGLKDEGSKTTVKPEIAENGINANGGLELISPYEVTELDLYNFVYKNYDNIFDNGISNVSETNFESK